MPLFLVPRLAQADAELQAFRELEPQLPEERVVVQLGVVVPVALAARRGQEIGDRLIVRERAEEVLAEELVVLVDAVMLVVSAHDPVKTALGIRGQPEFLADRIYIGLFAVGQFKQD